MVPKTESQSLAITDQTKEPRERVTKKQKKTAPNTGGSGESQRPGAEGHDKQKPKSFCAASTALTGVMRKTAASKRARYQTAVRRRLRHLHRAKPVERNDLHKRSDSGLQRSSATEGPRPRPGTSVDVGLSGSHPKANHRDAATRHAGTAFGSLGRAEHVVGAGIKMVVVGTSSCFTDASCEL